MVQLSPCQPVTQLHLYPSFSYLLLSPFLRPYQRHVDKNIHSRVRVARAIGKNPSRSYSVSMSVIDQSLKSILHANPPLINVDIRMPPVDARLDHTDERRERVQGGSGVRGDIYAGVVITHQVDVGVLVIEFYPPSPPDTRDTIVCRVDPFESTPSLDQTIAALSRTSHRHRLNGDESMHVERDLRRRPNRPLQVRDEMRQSWNDSNWMLIHPPIAASFALPHDARALYAILPTHSRYCEDRISGREVLGDEWGHQENGSGAEDRKKGGNIRLETNSDYRFVILTIPCPSSYTDHHALINDLKKLLRCRETIVTLRWFDH